MINKISYHPAFGNNQNQSNTKRDIAVGGAGVGTAVVSRELAALGRIGGTATAIKTQAIKTASQNAAKMSNLFLRFTGFLERARMPWVARVLKSKPACKALGVFGSIGAVAITVAELFGATDTLSKIQEIAK